MRFYYDVFKFNFLTELAYPIEIVGFIIRKLINLGFLIFFWLVVSKTNSGVFDFTRMVSYFLISQAVTDLTFSTGARFGRDIQKMIKSGELSNHLLKPVDILRFLFASFAGGRTTVTMYALITLILGIAIYPSIQAVNFLLFIITLLFTAITGVGINILIGVLGFYSPEAKNFQNIYDHINKILSGALIPLDYFPSTIKSFASLSPFPVLAYYPTVILQKGGLNMDTYFKLGLCAFWAFVLLLIANLAWKKALKIYDGVGI